VGSELSANDCKSGLSKERQQHFAILPLNSQIAASSYVWAINLAGAIVHETKNSLLGLVIQFSKLHSEIGTILPTQTLNM